MIVIQKTVTRDIVGIANTLSSVGKRTTLWDPTKDDLGEVDDVTTIILNDPGAIGYKTLGSIPKLAKIVLLNTEEVPELLQKRQCVPVMVPLCADDMLYPPGYYTKEYACDASYISNFTIDKRLYIQGILGSLPAKQFKLRIPGNVRLNVVPFMGPIDRYNIIKLCKSSGVCIDFDFNIAIDLIYHGCKVITNVENDHIPQFTADSIIEVIKEEISKPVPVVNEMRDELGIITYREFLPQILEHIS